MDEQALRADVAGKLDAVGFKYQTDPEGDFWIPFEDAIVFVGARSLGEFPVVNVWSYVATQIGQSDGLLSYINSANCDMAFGKLCYYADPSRVSFETPLLGSDLDKSELKFAIGVAATMTDKFNDEIIGRWGGEKFVL